MQICPLNQINVIQRLTRLVLAWGTVGLCYTLAGFTATTATLLTQTAFDHKIPFNPNMMAWYVSFFIFIPAAFLSAPWLRVKQMGLAMQLSGVVAACVFVFYPTAVAAPILEQTGWQSTLLLLFRQYDSSKNCLPSLHAALTLIAAWGLVGSFAQPKHLLKKALSLIWAGLIVYSIVAVRRHLLIDVAAAGLALGLCAILIARKMK